MELSRFIMFDGAMFHPLLRHNCFVAIDAKSNVLIADSGEKGEILKSSVRVMTTLDKSLFKATNKVLGTSLK